MKASGEGSLLDVFSSCRKEIGGRKTGPAELRDVAHTAARRSR